MLKYRADGARSAARARARRVGLIAIPLGATLLLAAFLLPSSCAGSFVREVSVNTLAEVIAPQVIEVLGKLGGRLFLSQDAEANTRVRQQVGLQFAHELARDHHYWCGKEEPEKTCIERIAPLAAADFADVLRRWDESLETCRQAVIENPAGQQAGEIEILDEIFECMGKRGYTQQMATLRLETGKPGI